MKVGSPQPEGIGKEIDVAIHDRLLLEQLRVLIIDVSERMIRPMRLSTCDIEITHLLETILPSINASCINSSIRSSTAKRDAGQRKPVKKERAITESSRLICCFTGPGNIDELWLGADLRSRPSGGPAPQRDVDTFLTL